MSIRLAINGLHRLFQFLGRPERDLLAGLDLDGFAGRRVPTHPGGTLPDLEDAQAVQANFVTFLQVLRGERHQIAQHGLSLLLREVMAIGQLGGEVLQRDCGLRRSFRWGGLLGSRCGFLGWWHDDLPVIRSRTTCSHRSGRATSHLPPPSWRCYDTVGKPWRRRCGGNVQAMFTRPATASGYATPNKAARSLQSVAASRFKRSISVPIAAANVASDASRPSLRHSCLRCCSVSEEIFPLRRSRWSSTINSCPAVLIILIIEETASL